MNTTYWWDFCVIAEDVCNDCIHRDKTISFNDLNSFRFCKIAQQNQFMLIDDFINTKCVRTDRFKLITKMKRI